MDGTQFDGLAKAFSIPSRRGIFAGAATAALASLAAVVGRGEANATKAAKGKKKKSARKSIPGPQGPQGPQGVQGPPGPVRIAYADIDISAGSGFNHRTSEGVTVQVVGEGTSRKYCFSLPFRPTVAVGSANVNNNAVVVTTTQPNSFLETNCPEGFRDAAALTRADDGIHADVYFQIIFL